MDNKQVQVVDKFKEKNTFERHDSKNYSILNWNPIRKGIIESVNRGLKNIPKYCLF